MGNSWHTHYHRSSDAVKSRSVILPALASVSIILSCITVTAQAKTYRWVDADGRVHYSDQIPPNEVDRAYSVINKGGVTIDNVGQAKTKEQLAEERRLKEQQTEQENYDRILLDTYTKVDDLEDTRDRYIASLEGLIKVSQHKLANLNNELDKLNKSAANLERNGKPMPDELRNDIASIQSQIDRENDFIVAQRAQQKEVKEKFASDIKRYKELKSAQQSAR